MGLVSPEAIQSVVEPGAAASQPPPAGYPMAQMPGFPGATSTPPVGMPYPAPSAPPQGYGAPAPAPPAPAGQDQDALMKAVMELPQAQIDMLPEMEKQQIMALRASYGGQRR